MDMIYAGGFTPSVAFVTSEESPATADEAKKLNLPEGTKLMRVNKLCTANKNPAIYCEDMFDASLLAAPASEQNLRAPVFQLLQEKCRLNCFMDVAKLLPVVADEHMAEILKIAPGTPLLYIEEVDYDVDGNPILYSRQYFVSGYFDYNILRKRL